MKKGFLAGFISLLIAKVLHYIVTYSLGYCIGYYYRNNIDDLPWGFIELMDGPIVGIIFLVLVSIFIYKKLTSNYNNNIDSQNQ
tara:strand:+ start:1044 stop:1295 length:252 start_codon:yes stop_codon:yes gene_type:complete